MNIDERNDVMVKRRFQGSGLYILFSDQARMK